MDETTQEQPKIIDIPKEETIEHIRFGITSGYFNPVHKGHIELFDASRELVDYLLVIINNDKQQILKKGKIIMDENERKLIMTHIFGVHGVYMSIDEDSTVCKSIEDIYNKVNGMKANNEEIEYFFLKGGDRSDRDKVPEAEVCDRLGIKMLFNVGGNNKTQSSSNINNLVEETKNE